METHDESKRQTGAETGGVGLGSDLGSGMHGIAGGGSFTPNDQGAAEDPRVGGSSGDFARGDIDAGPHDPAAANPSAAAAVGDPGGSAGGDDSPGTAGGGGTAFGSGTTGFGAGDTTTGATNTSTAGLGSSSDVGGGTTGP